MSLFDGQPDGPPQTQKGPLHAMAMAPLAERMRPRTLEEYSGQEHLLGPGKPLRVQIERDSFNTAGGGSMILWGPPGVGKTTLAKIIAETTQANFIEFSAVMSGIKEIKQVMATAAQATDMHSRTILFVDEIHRFNKAQQDAFLPYVERGTIRLIGATTENPSFEIISALLSRCRVYVLQPLSEERIAGLLRRALEVKERGLGDLGLTADDEALELIAGYSSGDCRSAYNTLEVAAQLAEARASAESGTNTRAQGGTNTQLEDGTNPSSERGTNLSFVTGHDFSRADSAEMRDGALAPAEDTAKAGAGFIPHKETTEAKGPFRAAERGEILDEKSKEYTAGAEAPADSIGAIPGINPRPTARTSSLKASLAPEPRPNHIDKAIATEAVQQRVLMYDKSGEEHYNLISALHKSVRNSDADAALYWLARMFAAGEDPLYLARRVVRMAVEDIGLAAPEALNLCLSAKQAMEFLGSPEGDLALAEAVVYLALAPKSNSVYTAWGAVQGEIEHTRQEPVPLHLRNAPTRLMKQLDYGKGYQYAHDEEGRVADMDCLPESLKGRSYFKPTQEGREKQLAARIEEIRRIRGSKQPGR
jgi:putative ATPase